VPEGASKTEEARVVKEASAVSTRLRKGQLSFSQAASRYSEHAASSLNGGFMGILQTADLKPDIKQHVLTLKEGEASKPVRGQNGVHIFLRGALLPSHVLSLEQVRPKVRQLLLQALRKKQQQQLNDLAKKEYPQPEISDRTISEWYQKIAGFYK
jgi:parvulin-like peptidyl-prolyl isomerase